MKRSMLINGQRPEELRVAIVADGQLENYLVDVADAGLRRGNIFRGVVAGVQTSLNAAFVEFGADRHGFLAAHDVVPEACHRTPPKDEKRPRIDQLLERGRPVVVQVTKDAQGGKGAALTTNISLAGRYLVFTPFDAMRGLSRKVEDEATRRAIKEKAKGLTLPDGAGYIIRTNAADQTKTTLNRDLGALLRLWKRITTEAQVGRGPKLLYSDQDLIIQVLRDYLDANIQEVWVDNEALLEKADLFVKTFMPRSKVTLKGYTERLPLFSRFKLEPQIDAIFQRTVPLPCGGSIVIDPTEALTAIDVNSGKAKAGGSQEDTILKVNLEAAAEVARQLRLRDIGGLIVVDLIDMRASKHRKAVEKAMRDALKLDKARTTVTHISENGLMEINRQRLQQALQLRTHRNCPTCGGLGLIASPEHVALGVVRRIEARAAEGTIQGVRVSLHPELADHIQNQHRRELAELEEEFDLRIDVIATSGMHRHEEELQWLRRERPLRREEPKPAPAAAATVADLSYGVEGEEEDEREADLDDFADVEDLTDFADIDDIEDNEDQVLPPRPPAPAVLEPGEVGASATAPRKRRRRRRKTSSAVEPLALDRPPTGERGAGPGAEVAPAPEHADEDVGNGDPGSASKKRRRRRRKSKTGAEGVTQEGSAAPEGGDAPEAPRSHATNGNGEGGAPTAEGDGAPAKSRRRRRRRR